MSPKQPKAHVPNPEGTGQSPGLISDFLAGIAFSSVFELKKFSLLAIN